MLQIYHAPNTRGIRVIWLCEELGLPYEVIPVDFSPAYRATPEWRAKHPVGKVPVMTDGETTMFESCAMMQYILARHGSRQGETTLEPDPSTSHYAHYLQWLWFGEATLSRPLGEIVNHGRAFPGDARLDPVVDEMAQRAVDCMKAVAEQVATQEYLIGNTFSAADISVGYGLHLAGLLLPDQIPTTLDTYRQRLADRPGFAVAVSAC